MNRAERRAGRLEAMTDAERQESLLRLSGYLGVWRRALAQQRQRLREQSIFTGGADTWLYVIALGAALRCVGLAEKLGVDVTVARATFERAVPNAKHVRDVIEHLEDYELGVGDYQTRGDGGRLEFLWCSSDQGIEYLELQGVGLRFDLEIAHDAALHLLDEVMNALCDARQ